LPLVRNLIQFGVVLPQGFRHLYFAPFQNAEKLQGVNDRFALKMIVGDDERIG